jgi:pimeloyl-ACP methyl ester carboxylesterase
VLDSLNVRNALMVPQAVSGSVVYRLAFHRPDLVRGIVGIDAGASEEAGTSGVRNAMKLAPLIRILGAKRILTGKIKDGLIDASYDPKWVTQDVLNEYAAPYRENAGNMLNVLKAISNAKEPELIGPNLPKVQVPVVLLVGVAAKTLTPEKIAVLQNGLPNFTVQRVEAAGQLVNEEQPAVVVEAILKALGAP